MQCTNHLKQIGLAVHNFHDTQQGLPPDSIGAYSRLTFWFLILPFLEQQAAYSQVQGTPNGLGLNVENTGGYTEPDPLIAIGNRGDLPGGNQEGRVEFLRSLARISVYYCPSRRAAGGTLTTGARAANLNPGGGVNYCRDGGMPHERWAHGPPSDYAITGVKYDGAQTHRVSLADLRGARPLHHDTLSPGQHAANVTGNWEQQASWQRGPFRGTSYSAVAVDGSGNPRATNHQDQARLWTPRDDMSWWQDGSSNQILAGEKHMLQEDLYNSHWDGTWLWKHGNTWHGTTRIFQFYVPFERAGMRDPWECHHSHKRFGGPHPGGTNFVMGDGSVRTISPTAPLTITIPLSHVSDGNSVTLP
jgi:prepilin-type processing-associated H-X9-DG protein